MGNKYKSATFILFAGLVASNIYWPLSGLNVCIKKTSHAEEIADREDALKLAGRLILDLNVGQSFEEVQIIMKERYGDQYGGGAGEIVKAYPEKSSIEVGSLNLFFSGNGLERVGNVWSDN